MIFLQEVDACHSYWRFGGQKWIWFLDGFLDLQLYFLLWFLDIMMMIFEYGFSWLY